MGRLLPSQSLEIIVRRSLIPSQQVHPPHVAARRISWLTVISPARPAFDCRGTLTIAFSKNSRTINVAYEHTPIHKTVGEMIEHFRPLPPAPPPVPLIPAGKSKKTPRKRKSAVNEDGTPVEPKRKRKSAVNEDGTPAQPKKRRKKKSEAVGDAPEGAAGGAGTAADGTATVPTKADAAVQSGVHSHAVLNVPPAEAARRRETAIRILSDSGVDPESLSTEQFSIFANQSPELQKESLSMLVKYGAERLRIVHPGNAAASSSASEPTTPQQATSQADATSLEEAPVNDTPAKKKRSSKPRTSIAREELIPAPHGTPLRLVSRGSCISCRVNKTKVRFMTMTSSSALTNWMQCDRQKPTCDTCLEQGLACQYPLINKQAKRKKTTADEDADADTEAEADAEAEAEADVEADPEPEPEPEPEAHEEQPDEEQEPDDIETIDYTSNMPVSNMLTPAAAQANQDYFNSGPSELSYTQTAANDMSMSHAVTSYAEPAATLTYADHMATTTSYSQPSLTETTNYSQPVVDSTYNQPAASDTMSYTQPKARSPKASRTSATSGSRRSLPSGQPQQNTSESPVPLPTYAQNWQGMTSPKAAATSVSPTLTTRQARSRKATQTPVPAPAPSQQQTYDNTQQAAARAALQQQQQQPQHHQQQPSPTPQVAQAAQAQVSPFQASAQVARAKSRTGQRASNRTPVNTDPRPTPSHHTVQPTAQSTMAATSYSDAQSLSNVANYNNYTAKYSNTSNNQPDTRIAYEPYTAQTTSAGTATYSSYDSYERANATAQNNNLSYTPSNNSRPGQWSNNQTRNTTATSYSQPSTTTQQQTASLQSFNMRGTTSSQHNRSSSTKYQQQSQQPQQQQPQQQQPQTQPYGSYSSQAQQQATQPDQHNWYGFGSSGTSFGSANNAGGYGARNSASAGYGSNTAGASQAYQQGQHHGSLNMSGHGYTGTENEIYDLLKNSLHGSGR